jgi:uncharacterized membrane protein YphA (DoxX/SURF4 family)
MKLAILFIILRLILGGFMVIGGVDKFKNDSPTPIEVYQKASKFTEDQQQSTLQKILYISGMKQTGYLWQLLGVCEIVFGLLLIIQGTSFVAALFLLPITLNIFLFHYFLEPEEMPEFLQTASLFLINLLLVIKEYKRWWHLVWIKPI